VTQDQQHQGRVIIGDPEHVAATSALFDDPPPAPPSRKPETPRTGANPRPSLQGEPTPSTRDTTERAVTPSSDPTKPPGKPRGIQLTPAHTKFVNAYLQTPDKPGQAYLRVYLNASPRRASERAYRLLKRPDIRAEIQRRQKISETKHAISRAAVEQRLYDIFTFDLRRFYYPATDESGQPHPKAGQPKEPHELDDEAARVIESYKHVETKEGRRREFKIGSRKDMAELLGRMRGWVKQDSSPPITANFHFDFGPKPVEGEVFETVPLHLSGLKDASTPSVRPLEGTEQPEEGVDLPPGYRGVRPGRAAELAEVFAPRKDEKPR